MIDHVLASASALQPKTTTVVVGHQAEALKAALSDHPGLTFVVQEPQLGTAHALLDGRTGASRADRDAGDVVRRRPDADAGNP